MDSMTTISLLKQYIIHGYAKQCSISFIPMDIVHLIYKYSNNLLPLNREHRTILAHNILKATDQYETRQCRPNFRLAPE